MLEVLIFRFKKEWDSSIHLSISQMHISGLLSPIGLLSYSHPFEEVPLQYIHINEDLCSLDSEMQTV